MQIPYGRQSIDDDDIAAVVDVLRGDWLTQGPAVSEFEEAFARACDVPHAVAFSSGTAALHGAVFAAEVGPGDEVVTSAMTFTASANCAAYVSATPRFADIERKTWNVGADSVRDVRTARTRLVIPVHYAGLASPVAEIRAAVGDGVKIVEDASHALGARTSEEVVGACSHSDMTVFSFHPVKVITTGEGGVVTTRSKALADRLRLFRSHGLTKDAQTLERDEGGWWQEQHVLGFNYRLTDIQAALGRSQLRKLDRFVERRNEVAARYRELLAGVESIELPPEAPSGSRHAYHLFVVRCRGGGAARRWLYYQLRERGILAQVHYAPVYFHPWYRDRFGYDRGLCPEAERLYAGCLSLPCFPSLSDDDQRYVVAAIEDALAREPA
jgi:UDP-4-amino-4,6-dideoxy-N-acetyl-beta-L-altrosamine transaminase